MKEIEILDWLLHHFNEKYSGLKWAELVNVEILDPDGWRQGRMGELPLPERTLYTEIGLEEFLWRLSSSTIKPL